MATCFALTPSFKTEALNISQMAFSVTWKLMHSISTSFSQCCLWLELGTTYVCIREHTPKRKETATRRIPSNHVCCLCVLPHLAFNIVRCRLELPDGEILCVKVKPDQSVKACLEPILYRQGLSPNHVITHLVRCFHVAFVSHCW